MIRFTSPKMVSRWLAWLSPRIAILVIIWVLDTQMYLKLLCTFVFLVPFVIVIMTNEYGMSTLRSFIVVKINKNGISNVFCKIKWEEIQGIQYEGLKIKHRPFARLGVMVGESGLVMFVNKEDTDTEKNFKNYSLKHTICLPFDDKTQSAIDKFCPKNIQIWNKETTDTSVSP